MIRVRLFAALRELAGDPVVEAQGRTVGEIADQLSERYGERFATIAGVGSFVVNGERVGRDTPVAEGDDVALLPPVSGGAAANDARVDGLLRSLAPRTLGALVRRYGAFDACEDAVQEALVAASRRWRDDGVPDDPSAWLMTVASRRLVDERRSEGARRRREDRVALMTPDDAPAPPGEDDTLTLLFICCHPSLTPASQVALTLRAVGGLTTAEIARAFMVPEATMAQRISRAKQRIRASGVGFEAPAEAERAERLRAVEHVLYLIFNEGYASSEGPAVHRADLTAEAIRLTRRLRQLVRDDPEVIGLLALMLLTDARRAARADAVGALVPLADQRRDLWDRDQIEEGLAIITVALGAGRLGPYQVQAAIAALHDEARNAEATDWPQILALYDVLLRMTPAPVVALNRAVALAMVEGPSAGLATVDALRDDERLAGNHRVEAVRGHLLELAGDRRGARLAYLEAASMTSSAPERDYLERRARHLREDAPVHSAGPWDTGSIP